MVQGKKFGARHAPEFKAKVLERVITKGEPKHDVAAELKVSSKTIDNWMFLHRRGKLGLDGLPKVRNKKKGDGATTRAAKSQTPLVNILPLKGATSEMMQITIERLQNELAYVKKDRDLLQRQFNALSK